MPELAREIKVTRIGRKVVVTIDGEEFPWHLTERGITTTVDHADLPAVTLMIPAEKVRIDDDLGC